MKKSGVINPLLCEAIASLGHTDLLAICDAGLPIPREARRIDVSVTRGVPTFAQVLSAIAPELEVERVVMAEEAASANPEAVACVRSLFPETALEFVAHEDFKRLIKEAKAVVRTGEFSPYANVILYSGVARLFAASSR